MNHKTIDIGGALSTGWARFQKYPGLAIGGMLLYAVITAVLSWIPIVNFIAAIFIIPPIVGGFYILFLRMTKEESPGIGDLFAGFSSYAKWLGVFWLFALICLLCFIPALICIGIGMFMARGAQAAAMNGNFGAASGEMGVLAVILLIIGYAISFIIYLIVMARYGLAYYAAADGAGAVESFKKSAELTEGVRPMMLLTLIVVGIIGAIGVIACGVGILVSAPVANMALASVYLGLKSSSTRTIYETTPAPPTYMPPVEPKPEESAQPTEETPPPTETK